MVLASVSTYSNFIFYFCFLYLNCTLQKPRIIVQYGVIVGRSLARLETNLTPSMTIFVFFPWFYRPSDNGRTVWKWGLFDGAIIVWCLVCGTQIASSRRLVLNIKCPDCDSQKVQHQAPVTHQTSSERVVLLAPLYENHITCYSGSLISILITLSN